jgi:pyridoxal phosphate enzyme (YggS family)
MKQCQAEGHPMARKARLLAVSKFFPKESIQEVLRLGHRDFAENKVQEAQSKYPDLRQEFPDITLHLIGPLQSNKTKDALELAEVIHTLDRPKLAHSLKQYWDIPTRRTHSLLVQVNTGREPQKAGILPEELPGFVQLCRDELHLPIVGLMCIPPVDEPAFLHFAWLRMMANRLGLEECSMGMSADWPEALRFGSTMIRVGSAIFGEREGSIPYLRSAQVTPQ